MSLTAALAFLASSCTVEVAVGIPCEPVVISEVMTANHHFESAEGAGFADWFELRNDSTTVEADLSGYVLLGNAVQYAACLVPEGTTISPETSMLFIASTYAMDVGDVVVCNLDFNNDGDGLQLHAGKDDDYDLCDSVTIPDLHYEFTWQRDPAAPEEWCHAEPTPGLANGPCLGEDP